MPYVEGFGTWPFGEEWLWEAIARLLPAAARRARPRADHALADAGARATSSSPPRRCDAAWSSCARSGPSLTVATRSSYARGGARELAAELERSAAEYAAAAERLRRARRTDCSARWARTRAGPRRRPTRSCRCWPPTLASSCRCRPAWPRTAAGSASWHGGFWLPECAYAPWLDDALEEAGVRATCVELTAAFGLGRRAAPAADRHRRRAGAVAAGSRDRGAGVGRGRVPGEPRLPRLPPPHRPRPPPVAKRRRARMTPRPRSALVARRRRGLRRPRPRARGGRGRVRVRGRHRAARATGGMRACSGWPRWSTRPRARG